jgi:hypothetical protein
VNPSPVRPKGRVSRTLAALLLGLQALLWGGGSILEAGAAAESLTRYAHVEDTSTTTCPPFHSHLDCVVCRAFSGGAVAVPAPVVSLAPAGSACLAASDLVARQDHVGSGTLPRAPPRA